MTRGGGREEGVKRSWELLGTVLTLLLLLVASTRGEGKESVFFSLFAWVWLTDRCWRGEYVKSLG